MARARIRRDALPAIKDGLRDLAPKESTHVTAREAVQILATELRDVLNQKHYTVEEVGAWLREHKVPMANSTLRLHIRQVALRREPATSRPSKRRTPRSTAPDSMSGSAGEPSGAPPSTGSAPTPDREPNGDGADRGGTVPVGPSAPREVATPDPDAFAAADKYKM